MRLLFVIEFQTASLRLSIVLLVKFLCQENVIYTNGLVILTPSLFFVEIGCSEFDSGYVKKKCYAKAINLPRSKFKRSNDSKVLIDGQKCKLLLILFALFQGVRKYT